MSRTLTHLLLLLVPVLLCASCRAPRKALERDRIKAERHLARAVWLYPDILRQRDTTVVVPVPRDSVRMVPAYSAARPDSLLRRCNELVAALAAENAALLTDQQDANEKGRKPGGLAGADAAAHNSLRRASTRAVENLRNEACQWQAYEERQGLVMLMVSPGPDGRPIITARIKPDSVISQKVPCPPQVVVPVKNTWQHVGDAVTSLIRSITFWILIAIILLAIGPAPWRKLLSLLRR